MDIVKKAEFCGHLVNNLAPTNSSEIRLQILGRLPKIRC